MRALIAYIREILSGAWSLASGMAITLRYMFKPVTTVQYPRQTMILPAAHRGHIELIPEQGEYGHRCVACGDCYRTCPSNVIKVQGLKVEAGQPNHAAFFFIDFSRCSLCGLCVEVCPEGALRYSREYDQVGVSRYSSVVDLMQRLSGQGVGR